MTTQQSTVFKRPAKLKFVGQWSLDRDLKASDWRIEVRCGACGAIHRFALDSMLHGVKSAVMQVISYDCPHLGVTCGLTLSGSDIKTGMKYLRRAQPGYKHIVLPVKPALVERPKRVNPMPAMTDWHERAK